MLWKKQGLMEKRPLAAKVSCWDIPADEKIDYIIKLLFQYFDLDILESEKPILSGLIAAAPQNLQKKFIGNYFLGHGFPGDGVVSGADQFAGRGD
jgi:hypothetical protein